MSERLPEYNLSSGADNTWSLTMKPQMLADLKNKAVTQAIETIRNRIDSLGVSEPTIQEHGLGQYQILVQLPGVDDPGRVKDIMQSTAMLEIKQVLGGPYPSEQAALQDKGGVLPPDAILLPGHAAPGAAAGGAVLVFGVARFRRSRQRPARRASRAPIQNGQPNVQLHADRRRRAALLQLHLRARGREAWAWCSTTRCRKSPTSRKRSATRAKSAAAA